MTQPMTGPTAGGLVSPYGEGATPAKPISRIRTHHIRQMKERGEVWPMLTAYDMYVSRIFDEAGIPVMLVGDSASNNVFGHTTSLPVTVDELLPLVRAVTRSTSRALIVADMPFGSYEASPEQAMSTAVRFMKQGRAHAVKMEGGRYFVSHVEAFTAAGIPVMGHLGFTPQSEHLLGGYRVQGRDEAAETIIQDALALERAGAFAIVLEMVSASVAKRVTAELKIPTIGIGAGPDCDAQVMVWQDMAGLRTGRLPRFVKQYADLASTLSDAARRYADDVRNKRFPSDEHCFE